MTNRYRQRREALARQADAMLRRKVGVMQQDLYLRLLAIIEKLDLDEGGNIRFTVKNTSLLKQVNLTVEAFTKTETGMAAWIGRKIELLTGLNALYFKSFITFDYAKIQKEVNLLTMLRLGYDVKTGTVTTGGYLSQIPGGRIVGAMVGKLISDAMASNQNLSTFRRNFRKIFVNPDGVGVLEKYYNTVTMDLFQQYDRQINLTYAKKLGLKFAVYSGTVMERTRPFCRENNNKVFTSDEIEGWREKTWAGKNKNYNPATDLGGYNCRHHLSWISEELAQRLRPELKNKTV